MKGAMAVVSSAVNRGECGEWCLAAGTGQDYHGALHTTGQDYYGTLHGNGA